ncbi:MAG: hypothetical protein AAGB24_09040 [Bacteroidota bacterium]
MEQKIWYCSYGSNLSFERFKLYLFGGVSPIVDKIYSGCTQKAKPEKDEFFEIPFELYFSKKVSFWDNGGVAFIKDIANEKITTRSRIYLISKQQFEEVVEQENNHFANSRNFSLNLEELKKNGYILLGNEKENQYYGKVILAGFKDGFPIITFTAKWSSTDIVYNRPSERYLKTIITGLSESQTITKEEIFSYLSSIKGIKEFYSENSLNSIIDEVYYKKPKLLRIQGTTNIKRNGQYWVQLPKNIFGNGKWNNPNFCLLTRMDRLAEVKAKIEYLERDEIGDNVINMDMKYRCALSLSKGEQVLVKPIRETDNVYIKNKTTFFRHILNKILGAQTNIVRVNRTTYNDMEVDICRITKESMNIIGVEHGDFVIIESAYGRARVRALEMTDFIINEMNERRKFNKNADFDCGEILDVKGVEENLADLRPILIDFDLRLKLQVNQCAPIQIRRSLLHEVRKKLHFVSTPIVLTILSSVVSFNYFDELGKTLILVIGGIILVLLAFIPVKRI